MGNARLASLLALLTLAFVGCSHNTQPSASETTGGAAPTKPKPTVPKLTRLGIKDVKVGDGGEFKIERAAKAGDEVFMVYTGKLADGTVFDSNDKQGGNPFSFVIGEGHVIKGWEEGVPGMKIGGVRKLSIPAELGYGSQDKGTIPPDSDLYFDVKLLDIISPGKEGDELYDDKKVGTGPEIKKGKTVTLKYRISDLNNNELDAQQATEPYGTGAFYPPIDTGLAGMREGGTRVLRLPRAIELPTKPSLGAAPPGVELVRIEVLKVQ